MEAQNRSIQEKLLKKYEANYNVDNYRCEISIYSYKYFQLKNFHSYAELEKKETQKIKWKMSVESWRSILCSTQVLTICFRSKIRSNIFFKMSLAKRRIDIGPM